MEYRKLGGSDLEVSIIGFGAWGVGGDPFWVSEGETTSVRSIKKSYELGINFFDTAPVYGFGRSEELIGKALEAVRSDVIYATKCGLRWKKEELGSIFRSSKKESIFEEVNESLRRLKTDFIDLYQVHWPDEDTEQEETMEALLEIQQQGKIRYVGVSNYSVQQMESCLKVMPISSLQPEYSLVNRSIENHIVPFCLKNDIGVIAYSPLASGVLTGKYDKDYKFKDWRSKGILGQFSGQAYRDNISKVDQLKKIAETQGRTCAQIAINWVFNQPGLATALVGVKNEKQMEANIQAVGWGLSSEIKLRINKIFSNS